jgi:transcriptional regulator with XRE-family HTH domain
VYHRSIKFDALAAAREESGLTQQEFADKCGHSQPYQNQLEHKPKDGSLHEVSKATADAIEKVLSGT